MVRDIVRDVIFLSRRSEPATKEDAGVVADLKDTLAAHRDGCVGMAATMIGVSKRIIIFTGDDGDVVMINPVISAKMGRYETQEGCLSLDGERMAVRFEKIEVRYLDENFCARKGKFSGFTAQIIQHECDHLEGIII